MENHGGQKLTKGRRKIEMKKILKKTSLQVTFTKRRSGLFKRASELSILCGSEVAIIVQSPAKKAYAFGSPSVEYVLHRFEMGASFNKQTNLGDDVKIRYDEAVRRLEEKKMELISAINQEIKEHEFWWNRQIEGMELQELEDYLESLKLLRKNVSSRIEEMEKLRTSSSPSSVLVIPNQGSMVDTFGGLPVQNNYQELEKLVEFNIVDVADEFQMKKDDGASGFSLGINPTYDHDFDEFLLAANYGNSSTFNLEAFLGGF